MLLNMKYSKNIHSGACPRTHPQGSYLFSPFSSDIQTPATRQTNDSDMGKLKLSFCLVCGPTGKKKPPYQCWNVSFNVMHQKCNIFVYIYHCSTMVISNSHIKYYFGFMSLFCLIPSLHCVCVSVWCMRWLPSRHWGCDEVRLNAGGMSNTHTVSVPSVLLSHTHN